MSCTWWFAWCVSLAQFTGHSAALNIRILHLIIRRRRRRGLSFSRRSVNVCLSREQHRWLRGSTPLPFVCTDCPNPFQAVTRSLWFSGIMWSLCDSAQVRKSWKQKRSGFKIRRRYIVLGSENFLKEVFTEICWVNIQVYWNATKNGPVLHKCCVGGKNCFL